MQSILQCICRIECDVVSCVSPQNNICDDEYVEQNQEYDVRYHVVLSHLFSGLALSVYIALLAGPTGRPDPLFKNRESYHIVFTHHWVI